MDWGWGEGGEREKKLSIKCTYYNIIILEIINFELHSDLLREISIYAPVRSYSHAFREDAGMAYSHPAIPEVNESIQD